MLFFGSSDMSGHANLVNTAAESTLAHAVERANPAPTLLQKAPQSAAVRAQVMAWTGGVMVAGALLYPLLQTARARGWCEFAGTQPCAPACLLPGRPCAAGWAMCRGQPG